MKTQSQILNYPSLSEALFLGSSVSNTQRNIRYAVLAFAGSALIALCAQISVPFFPVPLTLQTFAVFLIGLSFGWRLGGITVALYLLEGALGLPVFAGGKGGLIVFMGPTAGYLYGMTIAAAVIGFFAEFGYNKSYFKSLISLLVGTFIIFLFGVGYLGSVIGYDKALAGGLYPFIPSEFFKIGLAVIIIPSITRYINK